MSSNRLAYLQGVATDEYQRHKRASAEAIQAYLDCGAALVEAKAACGHGEWLPWLVAAGVPERTAQRMMKLSASGLKSDTVTDMGGIRATLDYVATYDRIERAADLLERMPCGSEDGSDGAAFLLAENVDANDLWDLTYLLLFKVTLTPPGEHRGLHVVEFFRQHTAQDRAMQRRG